MKSVAPTMMKNASLKWTDRFFVVRATISTTARIVTGNSEGIIALGRKDLQQVFPSVSCL